MPPQNGPPVPLHAAETTATLETIAEAIKQIDAKKEKLKEAFDDLKGHSSLVASFSLSWPDLDAHFTSVQNSLSHRFKLLESLESRQGHANLPLVAKHEDPSGLNAALSEGRVDAVHDSLASQASSEIVLSKDKTAPSSNLRNEQRVGSGSQERAPIVVTRPELRELCERMDGRGLRRYISDHPNYREAIRVELPGAIRCAPDSGGMVLDAMEDFYVGNSESNGSNAPQVCSLRRVCVLLLEQLMDSGVTFGEEVRERAKKVALEWKQKASSDGGDPLEALGLLHLVATYGLGSEFDSGELVGYFVVVARYRQATKLCRAIGLGEKIHDLINKIVDSGKQVLAMKFIFEFGLTEMFPPVPLLKTYLKNVKMAARKVCRDGKNSLKSQNEATAKEVGALKAIIKVIEEHKLQSEYPSESLKLRIEQLEKLKASRRRPAAPAANSQQQGAKKPQVLQQGKKQPEQQHQSRNKRLRTTGSAGPSAVPRTAIGVNLQGTGLFPDHSAAYLSVPCGPYGMVGSAPVVAHYAGSSIGSYGLSGARMGFAGNPNPAGSNLYSSESHMPTGYDRSTSYVGYVIPPQYHPSYYTQ